MADTIQGEGTIVNHNSVILVCLKFHGGRGADINKVIKSILNLSTPIT